MKRCWQFLGRALHAAGSLTGSFVLWTIWLGLAALLMLQIYVATTSELTVPDLVMHRLESRLAESGLRATFRRASFDPTGRVLLEDARLSVPPFAEPVLQARMVYVRLNPLLLVVGKAEPREIRISGATAGVPAMLAPSGQAEEIVRDLDLTLLLGEREIVVTHCSARIAGMPVTAHGTIPLPRLPQDRPRRSLVDFMAGQFPTLCRQAIAGAQQLAALQQPSLDLDFVPSESGSAQINVLFLARGVRLEQPFVAQADNLQLATRVLVFGELPTLSRIEASAGELRLPLAGGFTAREVRAVALGRLRPEGWQFEPRTIELMADYLDAAGVAVHGLSAEIFPRPLPRVDAVLAALVGGEPIAIRAEADLRARSGSLRFEGSVSPMLLDPLSERVGVDVRKFFDFGSLHCTGGEARFGPGWTFERLAAEVAVQRIRAHGVTIDEGRASIALDPIRFHAPEAYGRIGTNFARGSYTHEFATHGFRFLLAGKLRPMAISGWFSEWWPDFFRQLEFPEAAPAASVEVSGTWKEGARTAVFVYADASKPVIRGAALDHVRTRLFIRPGYFDGLEMFATQGTGAARGTFTYRIDGSSDEWRAFDVAAESSLDLAVARQIAGAAGTKLLAPFELSAPPELRLRGHFDGPGSAAGEHLDFSIDAATAGDFRFYHFPLQDVSFTARLRDDEITLDKMEARFAGGSTSGKARVWGAGAARRLGFDCALKGANLGAAAAALAEFVAHRSGLPAVPPGKFVQEKANVRIDFAASAEGRYDDILSYHGEGNAVLEGAEIGEVPLLGGLSDLLKFTALRFTSARANFKINGPKLLFPEIALRGANSGIDGHGEYELDRHELDFNAKIFPFYDSGNLIKSVVGAVLTPFSNVFEVKLTGSLQKPAWGLAKFSAERPPENRRPEAESAEKSPSASRPAPPRTLPGPVGPPVPVSGS